MPEPPACNASPLIVLARAGHLDLLQAVYGSVVVPGGVADEVLRGPGRDPAVVALQTELWLERTPVGEIPLGVAAWDLGAGEAEVLTWALGHPECEAVLDDRAGRRCARALGIPYRGTLGVVLLAKKRGVIPAARPIIEALRRVGLYVSPELQEQALSLVGEQSGLERER